jgi:MFS transporter, FHS family, glucose/mannose:H+ symporter
VSFPGRQETDSSLAKEGARFRGSMPDTANFNRTFLLAAANACMFVFGVVLLLMGSLLPSLQVTYSQAGNLGSFPLAGILVATLLVGPILDLMGAKPVLAVALLLIAASLALMSALDSYAGLALSAFTYGLGGGMLNTAANALVAELSSGGRASALNLLGFFFSLGAILAPLTLSSLGGSFAVAAVLRGLAILCLLILGLVLALQFPAGTKPGTGLRSLLAVLDHPVLWLFAGLLFFESGSENCMFVWASKIAADGLHVAPEHANLALVALSAALGAGRLAAIVWLRWLGSRGTIWLSTAIILVGSLVVLRANQLSGMVAGMLVIGLGLSAIFPTALGMAGDRFPGETGTVFGAIMTVALVGGTAGPKLAGRIASYGLRRILLIPVCAAVVVAVLTATLAKRRRQIMPKASAEV